MEKRGYATCGNRPTPTAARGENSLAGSRAVYWDRAVVLLRLVALDLSLGQARPMAILLYYRCMQKLASGSSTPIIVVVAALLKLGPYPHLGVTV